MASLFGYRSVDQFSPAGKVFIAYLLKVSNGEVEITLHAVKLEARDVMWFFHLAHLGIGPLSATLPSRQSAKGCGIRGALSCTV